MKITVKATDLDLTPALKEYIETKLRSLNKFVDKWDLEGAVEARVEVARTTRHHHKGDVLRAEVNLHLPKQLLRAEAEREDVRLAINEAKDELQRQIKKYNEIHK